MRSRGHVGASAPLASRAYHRRGVEGDLPEERPPEPRREAGSCAAFPALDVFFIHSLTLGASP